MAWRNYVVLACRLCQISFAIIAFSFTLAIASGTLTMFAPVWPRYKHREFRGDVNQDDVPIPNGYFLTAGAFSCANVGLLGAVGLLAIWKPGDIPRYLMLLFDVAALAFSIAAGTCVTYDATWYFHVWGSYLIPAVFAFACTLPLGALMLRSLLLSRKAAAPLVTPDLPLKHLSNDSWSYEHGHPSDTDERQLYMVRLESRVEQLEKAQKL